MENLTTKEQETLKILIRLGDSKELALKTIISGRISEEAEEERNAFYKTLGASMCLGMSSLNIPFLIQNPLNYLSWFAMSFCFGMFVGLLLVKL